MEPILEIKDLRKEYKEFSLNSLSLSLPEGYIMGLIGPNGAGKTTTIKLIMNLIRADGGEITVFGKHYRGNEKLIKNDIGYVGEEQYFYEDRSVAWTGRFVAKFFRGWELNTFSTLLSEFELSSTKKVKELSRGMRVKLSLAIALSHNPKLIILDEPTAGLDPVVRRDVLELLRRVTAEDPGKSVIISSHITDDIERIADSVTYLIDGKIALSGEKDELLANWKKIHYRAGALPGKAAKELLTIEENVFGSSGVTRDFGAIRDVLDEGVKKDDIRIENMGLDDILITLVRGEI
jgi:ABC-2 type transport system ATP-binding protein